MTNDRPIDWRAAAGDTDIPYEYAEGIGTVAINRPERHNVFLEQRQPACSKLQHLALHG